VEKLKRVLKILRTVTTGRTSLAEQTKDEEPETKRSTLVLQVGILIQDELALYHL
jgi:hypothetical protein